VVWESYPYLVRPEPIYVPHDERTWNIVSCILTKLHGTQVVAYPWSTELWTLDICLCGTGWVGTAALLPPYKAQRLIQEHPDLYAQCSCELYPDDCKKEGDEK